MGAVGPYFHTSQPGWVASLSPMKREVKREARKRGRGVQENQTSPRSIVLSLVVWGSKLLPGSVLVKGRLLVDGHPHPPPPPTPGQKLWMLTLRLEPSALVSQRKNRSAGGGGGGGARRVFFRRPSGVLLEGSFAQASALLAPPFVTKKA